MRQETKNLLTVFENKLISMWQLDGQLSECEDDNRYFYLESRQRILEKEVDDARGKLYAHIIQLEQENSKLRERSIEDSWSKYPDRSGGQFTQDEIEESKRGGHGW